MNGQGQLDGSPVRWPEFHLLLIQMACVHDMSVQVEQDIRSYDAAKKQLDMIPLAPAEGDMDLPTRNPHRVQPVDQEPHRLLTAVIHIKAHEPAALPPCKHGDGIFMLQMVADYVVAQAAPCSVPVLGRDDPSVRKAQHITLSV